MLPSKSTSRIGGDGAPGPRQTTGRRPVGIVGHEPGPEEPMTVRERLRALHEAVATAEQERCEYVAELREEGFSLREIAHVLKVAPSTVMRWGPVNRPTRTLDDPA